MGGADKGLILLHGRALIEHVVTGLQHQVGRLLINANRNREKYAVYGFPVITDSVDGYCGPLAGMLSAMQSASTPFLLCAPCDCPSPPPDLAARLAVALFRERVDASVAAHAGRLQPVFVLMRCSLAERLRAFLIRGGRGVGEWLSAQRAAVADFSDYPPDVFANINTKDDIRRFERSSSIGPTDGRPVGYHDNGDPWRAY